MDPNDPSLPPPNEMINHHYPQGLDEFGQPIKNNFEGIHASEERTANRELFSLELEFVQALASPFYLYNLAVEGYLDDPVFLNYLKYLGYWKEKEYARFIITSPPRLASTPKLSECGEKAGDSDVLEPLSIRTLEDVLRGTSAIIPRRVKSRPPILDSADSAGLADNTAAAAQQPPQAGEAGPPDQTAAQPGP
ncbi:suppressor of hpr1 [Tulasnella sp. 417]|nr:suppressor of hpr1 [Tulasnella sp. 417]